jgi:mannose/cellobiose epimerase-like protein (N-acyl-D-glucosamine 2-epimerase family)
MDGFSQTLTVLGTVSSVAAGQRQFDIRLRTGDVLTVTVGAETSFGVLTNLNDQNNDRVPEPQGATGDGASRAIAKYVRVGDRIYVTGLLLEDKGVRRYDGRTVHLLHSEPGRFLFEETHWWLTQISEMANEWLDSLFGDSRTYREDDFSALYHTNLNIYGGRTDDAVQTMATLSRLIYGLSSAYLLTGDRRYREAAAAGIDFQRSAFRSFSHDGRHLFWSYGRRKLLDHTVTIVPSENGDDYGAIALYEQIYGLAGMTQYYRISGDQEVLNDIRRTIATFNDYFLDQKSVNADFPGLDGYFSHIDPVTMRPDTPALGPRQSRKNWNSVGDHIPAYLINLILALEPLPKKASTDMAALLDTAKTMLDRCTRLILSKFPDPESAYVNERFFADWTPDHEWGWQQNRAIVGHNLKIAWNLTRIASYYRCAGREEDARNAMQLAERLGNAMITAGVDRMRGGCFDAVERKPTPGQPIEFVWGNTKDFWQQEQAALAYLIMYGYTGKPEYIDLARDMCAAWNMFFLDRQNRGINFRISDIGLPVIDGQYGQKGSYAEAGYHSFELNYLAHVYMRTYVAGLASSDDSFSLYFRPDPNSSLRSINVAPDFLTPGAVEIVSVSVDGRSRDNFNPDILQVPLETEDLGKDVIVVFRAKRDKK